MAKLCINCGQALIPGSPICGACGFIQPRPSEAQAAPFRQRTRVIYALSGALLLLLFCLPWSGVYSWRLLPYLYGADFARQLLLAVGGGMLVSSALLPVPALFRAAIGVALGGLAFALGGILLGGALRVAAAAVVTVLAAALLLRTQMPWTRVPRWIGVTAALLLWGLFLLPWGGASPLRTAVALLCYRHDDMAQFIGTYLMLPLPLVLLSAVALLGSDVAATGELISWLLFCWGPGALLIMTIDRTQVYTAIAMLLYLACAGYGMAELLRLAVIRLED